MFGRQKANEYSAKADEYAAEAKKLRKQVQRQRESLKNSSDPQADRSELNHLLGCAETAEHNARSFRRMAR